MSGRARVYLLLAVVGAAVPLTIAGIFLADEGLDLGEFVDQLFETTISTMAFADLAISSLVFLFWSWHEARRVGIRPWWPFVAANLLVGLSFALPLFLFFRERRGTAPAAA